MRVMAHCVAAAAQFDHHCLSLEAYFVAYYATVLPCRSQSVANTAHAEYR